jgi:hypothetical protein
MTAGRELFVRDRIEQHQAIRILDYGSFFNNTVSTTLTEAVLAPMPNASVNTAIYRESPDSSKASCNPYRSSCQKVFILAHPSASVFIRISALPS